MGLYLSNTDLRRVHRAMETLAGLPAERCSGQDLSEQLATATLEVAAAVGAAHSVAFVPTGSGNLYIESATAPTVARAYAESFKGIRDGHPEYDDPLLTSSTARRVQSGGGVYHETELAERADVDASPFYNDMMCRNGLRHILGMSVPRPDGEAAIMVAFERPDARGFGRRGMDVLQLLYPAFCAGVRRSEVLEEGVGASESGKEKALPVLWFGLDGRLLHETPAARLILAADFERERLRREATDLAQSWIDYIRRWRWAEPFVAPRLVRTGAGPYWLRGAIRLGDSEYGDAVVVELVPPTGMRMSPEGLCRTYGLTRREAEIAYLIADGKANAEIAEILFISPHTARHHTERVLEKLGVHRRKDVASMIQEHSFDGRPDVP